MDNWSGEVEDGIQQPDENRDILWASKNLLEREIDSRLDSQWHRWPAVLLSGMKGPEWRDCIVERSLAQRKCMVSK